MGKIRKIGKVWYSDIYIGGKRVRKPLETDKRLAQDKLRDLIAEAHSSKFGGKNPLWSAFKTKYLEWSKGTKAANTHKVDARAIRYLESFRKIKHLAEIDFEFLDQWKAARKSQGLEPSTINREMNAIKAMLRKAMAWGDLEPYNIRVPSLKESRNKLIFYSPKECVLLLKHCHGQWQTMALLGLRAGLRRSEMRWLAWSDISGDILSVTPKDGWNPKDYETRHIPIPADLAEHLKGLKRVNEWVIPERPDLGVMTTYFRRLLRKAGLKGSIHTLRHTYASHLAQNGVDIYTISKLLGHSSVKTSEIYSHLAPNTFSVAVAKLPKF